MKKNNFAMFVMIMILTLTCVCTTGCDQADKAVKAASSAKETVVNTASDVKEEATRLTRKLDNQSWTNPTGTKIKIEERRKEGDFKITITYDKETLNENNRENVIPTGDATIVVYVDRISEEMIEELQDY